MIDQPETTTVTERPRQPGWRELRILHLGVIGLVAASLRFWGLESTSLWYDEVVTMRVARTNGLAALVERLDQIDGTRAPLHPLILQAWLRILGPSDLSGRSFSVLCGLATVGVIYLLGRMAFDDMTGRWAAWLAAVCPPLVYYSQEARMYAWLVLLSCASWLVFLSFRKSAKPAQCFIYWLVLTSLLYSHPLGFFMVAAHGLAFLLIRSYLRLSIPWWLAIQASVILSIVPWIGRYIDHGTDYPMPRHPIRFLLAVPIEYIGGNSIVLGICVAIIFYGMISPKGSWRRSRFAVANPAENLVFIVWASTPPLLMFLYSYLAQPIFGPPRYHVFIAPAYLILLAHGLSLMPAGFRWPLVAAALVLSLVLLQNYQQAVKADWRGLALWLERDKSQAGAGDLPSEHATIVVHPSDPRFPREELEAARYYLSPRFRVIPADDLVAVESADPTKPIYEVNCLAAPENPQTIDGEVHRTYGIQVKRK
jgi:4-amino-4-deoxy-L-arabinose transferase-like glycosyltransferase